MDKKDIKELLQSIDNTLKHIENMLLEDAKRRETKSTYGYVYSNSVPKEVARNVTYP